ncbi:MAG: hypothetical protein JKX87_02990 [Cycloclasticus sp.]|nr:hypothetical protein [Cycloclasticus sp.]
MSPGGTHNVSNALAAIAAAHHVGVTIDQACQSLALFEGIKRRLELRGEINGVRVYDDFAHHPTAIATTLAGLRANIGEQKLIAILELRSNTMKMGVHKETLLPSLALADEAFIFMPDEIDWHVDIENHSNVRVFKTMDKLIEAVVSTAGPKNHILFMSNGGFGGIHQKVENLLAH